MSAPPSNPVEIIKVLDSHMDHEVSLVLYGRASLALGFAEPRAESLSTKDVDAIRFLIGHDGITAAQMEPAFATARLPDVIELHEAFARALPAVRAMLPG